MNQEKFNFQIRRIQKMFPSKCTLNQGEMLQCINKSRSTFKRLLDANELNRLPVFRKNKYTRKNSVYYTYEFEVFEIAKFLSQEK